MATLLQYISHLEEEIDSIIKYGLAGGDDLKDICIRIAKLLVNEENIIKKTVILNDQYIKIEASIYDAKYDYDQEVMWVFPLDNDDYVDSSYAAYDRAMRGI